MTGTTTQQEDGRVADHQQGLEKIGQLLLHAEHGVIRHPREVAVVGHRVVHGGEHFRTATRIDAEVLATIRELTPLAPLHNPPNALGVEVAQRVFPQAVAVAVFDTAFHQTLPDYAFRYPLPAAWYHHHHVRAYGMHGTSHQYVAERAAQHLGQPLKSLNLITIHLGNGCSMTAVQHGESVDTSMGLTPLAGLMMGTRSGDIDPAIGYFIAKETGQSVEEINQILNNESGLRGISGSNDLREVIQQHEAGDDDARLALAMYAYRIKRFIGAYYAVLGQVDALIFTAGVGENSALIRQMSCDGLSRLGISVDQKKNQAAVTGVREIQTDDSEVAVLVIPTNEELAIAQQAYALAGTESDG